MSRYWYVFIGGTADPLLASNYDRLFHYPIGGCIDGTQICAIYSPGNAFSHPDPSAFIFGTNLYNYITAALAIPGGGVAQPPLGSKGSFKFFVYLRN